VTMLTAGVLGHRTRRLVCEDQVLTWIHLGHRSRIPVFVAALWLGYRFGLTKPWYWTAIVVCRHLGNRPGDMLVVLFRKGATRPTALWISTVITAALLASIIVFWRQRQIREMKRQLSGSGN